MPRNALGRGLGALIREPEPQVPASRQSDSGLSQPRQRCRCGTRARGRCRQVRKRSIST